MLVLANVGTRGRAARPTLGGQEWDRSVQEQGGSEACERFQAEAWNMYTNELDEIDKPSTLFDQLCWMKEAGFRHVDLYWMKAGHAIFGGVRAETRR